MLMVAECVFGPHVHFSGESSSVFHSLYHYLCCNSFIFLQLFSSHHSILPFFLPYISLSYLSANPNIIVTHTNVETQDRQACMNEHTNAYARRQTTMLMHTYMYKLVRTDGIRTYPRTCRDSDSGRLVLSCTATHCVYAEPLSLLVERCNALLTSGEENIQSCPLVIN